MKKMFLIYSVALLIAGGLIGYIVGTIVLASDKPIEVTHTVVRETSDNFVSESEKEYEFQEKLTYEIRDKQNETDLF